MREFLEMILGEYTPVTYDLQQIFYSADGTSYDTVTNTVVASGLAGIDWTFVFTGVCFCVLLWCSLKLLGGLICRIS